MKTLLIRFMFAGLLLMPLRGLAEDTDLFVGVPSATSDLPNVLIIVDNTANWNTAFTNEMSALVSVVSNLPPDTFKLGIMMFTETGGGNSGSDGAYVRAALRPLTAANKVKYQNLVSSFDVGNDKSNGGKIGQAMREAYLYFAGSTPYAGNNKAKTDYLGNVTGTTQSNAIYALSNNALNTKSSTTYLSPISSGCAKNFIIYISNGAAQDNNADTTSATTALTAVGGNTTTIPLSPSGSQSNMADEWARFMKNSSLGIVTYAVDVNKVLTGQGPGWTALLKSASVGVGGGKYFDVVSSGTQIADALNQIFTEIQAVNSVFASVSLPVSVNTQGTYLNQVYVGMFRPDENSSPRWAGNLKQYKLGYVSSVVKLVDADDKDAINPQTGFINECARSFWTPSSTDSYWSFRPMGNCLAIPNANISNYPDGNIVEKGAQAYKLRSTTTRTVYTCAPTLVGCTTLTSFSSGNSAITSALLGSPTDRTALINWALGRDVLDENTSDAITPAASTSAAIRPSVHADVVHSRPVAINYGTDISPQIVVFYGGNDGILRAVNGNRTADIGQTPNTVAAGGEIWSFMAPEFYPYIKRLYDNSPAISYPGSVTPGAIKKNYGFDGPVSAYIGTTDKWLYSSMRRGGRAIYAFNVSSLASPALKWKIGCDSSGCTTGMNGIGQTWAAPKVVRAGGYGAGVSPMLVLGGGYDTCEDNDPNTCNSSTTGNKVYIMDANTGALLNTFSTDRAVVADATPVTDSNGLVSYLYVADLGGNVYRISGSATTPIGTVPPATWVMTKIASLGCSTPSSCTANRKFMFAPDVAVNGTTNYVMIGSGDREKPLTSYASAAGVANYFFMIKDQPTTANWLTSEASTCGANVICLNSLALVPAVGTSPSQATIDSKKGWYLQLASTEQVVTSSITIFGVVTFSTHTPAVAVQGECSNLGVAKVYRISYKNASSVSNGSDSGSNSGSRYQNVTGGGLPPSPVAGIVTMDNGDQILACIGCTPDSSIGASEQKNDSSDKAPRSWTSWNIVK